MSYESLVSEVEVTLEAAMASLSMPQSGECLRCWLRRANAACGCDGTLRWVRHRSSRRGESWSTRKRWVRVFGAPRDCEALIHCFGEHFCVEHALTVRAAQCPDCG